MLAQDEATSAVYGMPQEAVVSGMVDQVLPIDDIPAAMVSLWQRGRRSRSAAPHER